MYDLHNIVLKSTRELLKDRSYLSETEENYLNELTRFSFPKKDKLLSLDRTKTDKFHYDFVEVSKRGFDGTPFSYFNSKKLNINFFHSRKQKELILRYLEQFGSSMNNLGTILSKSSVHEFYRQAKMIE